jgi:hypothetical protein
MGTLVQFLAAGVNGAASGTATFLLRGTASSAAAVLYSDFEGTTQPGTNVIPLDANGAAEVYCDAYVDVQLRSSAGSLLRTVTVGNSAPTVEVQSTSFTGTDYDGDPANTIGEPITLKAILDKWITSAGASNWQTVINGSPINIQAALAGFAGMFINVKDPTYGAEGDGVTDDTTAILAAIAAAQTTGGIVFFPPGTYQVTVINPTAPDVVLMGCGEETSILRGTFASSSLLTFLDNSAGSLKRVTGLGFAASASYQAFIDIEETQKVQIDHCKFIGTNITDAHIRRIDVDGENDISISDCAFTVVAADAAIQNLSDDGECYIAVKSCVFTIDASFVGAVIDGPDITVTESVFDGSACSGAEYHHVDAGSNEVAGRYLGSVSDCTFFDGGSSGFVFRLESLANGSVFVEENNRFFGFTDPVDQDDFGHIYDFTTQISASMLNCICKLGSRAGKILRYTLLTGDGLDSAAPWVVAETLVFTLDAAYVNAADPNTLNLVWPQHKIPPGNACKLVVINNEGGAINCRLLSGVSLSSVALSVADGGKGAWIGEVTQEVAGSPFLAIFGANALAQ